MSGENTEMPSLRKRMDEEEAGSPEGVPKLQTLPAHRTPRTEKLV